jgi:CRP-like cAMP-binding protein
MDEIRRVSTRRSVSALCSDAVNTDSLSQSMHLMGATMAYPRDTEIFGENEPADYLYKVLSGAVRTYKILTDGRRQVSGFYLPGDIFGLEFADVHTLSAEAISDAKVLVVKRSAVSALAGRDPSVAQQLFTLTGRELRRVRDRILLLIKNARERVASFLLEMAERASENNTIELPMSRHCSKTRPVEHYSSVFGGDGKRMKCAATQSHRPFRRS